MTSRNTVLAEVPPSKVQCNGVYGVYGVNGVYGVYGVYGVNGGNVETEKVCSEQFLQNR